MRMPLPNSRVIYMNSNQYQIAVTDEVENAPNIAISIQHGRVYITLNGHRLWNTMVHFETALVALNEKIKGLIHEHLEAQANRLGANRRDVRLALPTRHAAYFVAVEQIHIT